MAAPSTVLVSEQEYLSTQYEPDREFEDGVLIERYAGTEKHSWLQAALAAYFFRRRKQWGLNVYTEQRNLVRPGKYKLPDLCVVMGARPTTRILEQPPLLAIEILSPEDKPLRVDRTIAEWLDFGVGYVWVIDPETLESALHTSHGRVQVEAQRARMRATGREKTLRSPFGGRLTPRPSCACFLKDATLKIPGTGIEVPLLQLEEE